MLKVCDFLLGRLGNLGSLVFWLTIQLLKFPKLQISEWCIWGEVEEYVNVNMWIYLCISHFHIPNLSSKDYQCNIVLGLSGNLIYKLMYKYGYTYLHYHWYIDYYSQYLYIVWKCAFFYTEDRYILLIHLYISLIDIYNYYSYWYYLVICECESVKYIGKFTYSHSHINLIAISL